MQSSIKLGNNRPNATARKDDTPEQTKKVIILGGSIIKHVRGYDLSHSLEDCKVHVKNFPGARVKCMQDYDKPFLRENPHHFIIHVGTNDISTNQRPEQIAKSIVELDLSVKSKSCDVTLSDITVRNNGHQRKVVETNRHLKKLCKENNIFLIQHDKTIATRHLNGSKLHLNKRGTEILSNTFTESISNIAH